MWFGRSRVQDRAGDSDTRGVTDDPTARSATTRDDESAPDADAAAEHSGWVDEKVLSAAASAPDDATVFDNDRAIDALRAATTAAGTQTSQPTLDDIAQIHRLHDMRLEAEHRARRPLPKPGARRRFQYALTAETAALRLIGFGSYEAFSAVYGGATTTNGSDVDSTETIARIQELLDELGVDPHGDPLRAASEFLTTHETATVDAAPMPAPPAWFEQHATAERAATPEPEPTLEPEPAPEPEPVVATEPEAEPEAEVEVEVEHIVESVDITDFAAIVLAAPAVDDASPAPEVAERESGPEPEPDASAVASSAASGTTFTDRAASIADDTDTPPIGIEPDAPWVPAATLPPTNPSEIRKTDDDVLDRWIHAEARAERMHAEVDRAQAELVAMLARSADLEQTVVSRADELEAANVHLASANRELEQVRERVAELERSIARSDSERPALELALNASRERVTELEATLSEREEALAQAASDRESALETAAGLEATLATRTAELAEARASLANLEAELAAHATQLDHSRGELGAVRANADELTAELETTRRALDALDAHAEAIEAELAEARRAADRPETRHELEAVQRELMEARHELGHLELQRAETDRALAQDRIELQQLQHTLASTREEATAVIDELNEARRTIAETTAQVELAERAREAITIDAADVLARAEAEATNMLERANRDAEAIRQQAALESGAKLRPADYRRPTERAAVGDDPLTGIVARIERLERKLAKQRRRLDRISRTARRAPEAAPEPTRPSSKTQQSAVEELAKLVALPLPRDTERHLGIAGNDQSSAADVIATAEREAEAIRQAARQDREQFRAELMSLLSHLSPLPGETADLDDEDDDDEW